MMSINPFAVLAESIPSVLIQGFVIVMVSLVIIGTLVDIIHKKTLNIFLITQKKQNFLLQESLELAREFLL